MKISVIVPIYNIKEDYLRKCIESIALQNIEEFEILLVDDGSQNGCGQICKEYETKYPQIHYVYQENAGVSVARNHGMDLATGDYLLFVDADDYLEADIFEGLLQAAKTQETDLLLFGYQTEYENRHIVRMLHNPEADLLESRSLQLAILQGDERLGAVEVGTPWGKLIKRSVIEEHGIRYVKGVKKGQDTVFILQLLECCSKIGYLELAGYHYRISGASISKRYNPDIVAIMERTLSEYSKFAAEKDLEYQMALARKTIRVFLGEYFLLYFANHKNPASFQQKRKEAITLLKKEPYVSALKITDTGYFHGLDRIRYLALKNRCFLLLYLMQKAENLARDILIQKFD